MRITRILALAILVGVGGGLGGCFGGGADVEQHVSTVSQGQELADLKRALDEGAITQQEYDKLHQKILSRRY
jgi:hypothetical protein